jgi:hypothetical protein
MSVVERKAYAYTRHLQAGGRVNWRTGEMLPAKD